MNAPTGSANKWVIALTVMFGAFMAVMDISVVNVAMPHMMGSFGQNLSSITWVATSYSIAEIIMATMAGWWSTLLGRKRLYLLSFGVFLACSILAGTAHTFWQMIFFRTLQGVGGGSLIPVSQAILRETFPDEEQGMAMAVYGMGVVLAPAIGPILGGWLTDHYGWPWIFYINVPVGLIAMVQIAAVVKDPPYLRRGLKRVDWMGITLLAVCLSVMQVVLERGQEQDWFASDWIVAGTLVCVASLLALVLWELKVDEPVVDIRLLRNVPLSVGSLVGLLFGIGLFGTTFILPQFTQDLLGYPAMEAGLVLAPRAVTIFLFMPIVGWLYRHVDVRLSVFFGLTLLTWSFYDLSHLSLQASFWNLVPMLLIMGAGMPFMFVTLSAVSLATVPRSSMTEASSLYTLSRRVGGNIGYALVATVIASSRQTHRALLAGSLSPFNPAYRIRHGALTETLLSRGLDPHTAGVTATALLDRLMSRQVAMLAYNDAARIMGTLFLFAVPMILLLPGRRALQQALERKNLAQSEG